MGEPAARRTVSNSRHGSCRLLEYSLLDYARARELQIDLLRRKAAREMEEDVLIMLEHPPVFTLGRRGDRGNLLISRNRLEDLGIGLRETERGGDITYHGPGQVVAYPLLDIRAAGLGVRAFVHGLEEVMIRTAADFGVPAARRETERGAWAGPRKLGSLGIAVSRGISYHGLAFNVNLSLEPFSWINPCGMPRAEMTSLCRETGRPLSTAPVRSAMKEHFREVFGVRFAGG